MGKLIDLHVHSDCSDGTCSPEELVELAKQKGLSAFALTDHDTTEGVARARHAAEGTEVCVIPGIEFSTSYEKRDVHVLGLGIDPEDEYFQENLDRFRNSRDRRNEEMIRKMQEHGISITQEEVEKLFPDAVITRAHFARFLVEKKFVGSTNEAFDRYLGDRACCFVPREKVTPFQAVRLIKENGGYAVLAHPLIYGFSKGKLEELVREMKKAGAEGNEAI